MAKTAVAFGLLLAAGSLTGCISQGEYDKLFETNRSLTEDNARLTRERDEAKAAADLIRGSNVGAEGTLSDLQKQVLSLRQQRDKALADLHDLSNRMEGLSFGPLNAETDQALRELADKYPDLIKYDAASGMLRFASDLTFDSGSAVLKSDAKPALQALAEVLTSPAAAQYELWIEGHTDTQRVSANTAKLHPNNRYLSAHRAIAVIEELSRMGVNPGKMMAAGWGEYHPAVPNSATGNTPANRRVEIYLAKARTTTMSDVTPPAPTPAKPDRTKGPRRQEDVTK